MSNELNISLGQIGQTVIGRIYGGGIQIGTAITLIEIAGQGGYYTGDMPNIGAGTYDVQFFVDNVLRGSGNIAWNGTVEVTALAASAPTVGQIRTEIDNNSTRLALMATSAEVISGRNAVIAAVGSPLQSSSYVIPPSAASIAVATAGVLFVDGDTNRLKVNSDHSVNSSGGSGGTIENYITIPPAVAVASQDPAVITCIRGDTLRVALPLMGELTSRTQLVMTAKADVNDSDSRAVLQVVEGIGLTRLNGGDSAPANMATLTVSNASTGATNLVLSANITAGLAVRDLVWDVQAILSTGIISPIRGSFAVVADVTQSVT